MMKLKLFLGFVVGLFLFTSFCYAGSSRFSASHEHLNRLNKQPVKSIKSPDGDIIDCVHILHQPAFDHPLLKNHTIKMRPSSNPMIKTDNVKMSSTMNASSSSEKQKPVTQLWQVNGKCPKGTIPIRRTRKEDVLRATSVKSHAKKKRFSTVSQTNAINPDMDDFKLHEHVTGSVTGEFLYGGKASLNLWKPRIQTFNEFSLAQIWIIGESSQSYQLFDGNSIEAGWEACPSIYGDSNPRLFIYWTSDSYQNTGCQDLNCPGFIQTSNTIVLGAALSPTSEMLGAQYDITIYIWRDPEDGNWWMKYGGELVGYWPPSIFSYLQESAARVEFGGEVVNLNQGGQHTTTEMGSGQFANEEYRVASYVRNIQIVDGSNTLRDPTNIVPRVEKPNCYTIQTGVGDSWGAYFYFGGPGRNPSCP